MESRFSLKNLILWLSALLVALAGGSPRAMAHKTELEYRKAQAVQVEAAYSGGQPLSNAQVTVYAPNQPQDAWRTGTTDDQGRFTFLPDQSGTWEVRVRKAGHGSFLTVSVGEETGAAEAEPASTDGSGWLSAGGDTSTTNQVFYSAAGAWGFLGTALFFVRRRKDG